MGGGTEEGGGEIQKQHGAERCGRGREENGGVGEGGGRGRK